MFDEISIETSKWNIYNMFVVLLYCEKPWTCYPQGFWAYWSVTVLTALSKTTWPLAHWNFKLGSVCHVHWRYSCLSVCCFSVIHSGTGTRNIEMFVSWQAADTVAAGFGEAGLCGFVVISVLFWVLLCSCMKRHELLGNTSAFTFM